MSQLLEIRRGVLEASARVKSSADKKQKILDFLDDLWVASVFEQWNMTCTEFGDQLKVHIHLWFEGGAKEEIILEEKING